MPPEQKVNVVDPASGKTFAVDESEAARLAADGWAREGAASKVSRLNEEVLEDEYGGVVGAGTAALAGGVRTVTGGISDAVFRGLGVEQEFADLKRVNPGASIVGEVAGAFVPVGLPGLAARAGKAAGSVVDGAGIGAKLFGAAKTGVVEGAIYGAGSGVSEVALSKDPVSIERAISTIGSSALFGGAVGGVVGGALGAGGAALRKGKQVLDDVATRSAATGQVDDVAKKAFVDDVSAFRKATVTDELFLVTKGAADRETKTLGKIWLESDKAIDRALRNPKALVSEPKRVLAALQQQEHALEQVLAKSDDFAARFKADTTATRTTALSKVPNALEQNRALQSKIANLTAKPAEGLAVPGFAQNMLGGTAFGVVAGAVGSVAGPVIGGLAGAAASKFVTEGLTKALSKQAARTSKAIGAFLSVGEKVAPIVPVLATKALAAVSYGKTGKRELSGSGLAGLYKSRVAEVKSQTEYDVTGRAVMRADARARVADSLAPLRQGDPIAADRMETIAARRIEAIANRIPRKPDMAGVPHGPDHWQPSDMEMRALARFMHAVEDPIGIVERLTAGTVTPEDASAMKEVYPEMYQQIQTEILSKLPTLRQTLPFQRRLALSIFSGVPVDASIDPKVLSVIQAAYESEAAPPMPSPQFGSVKNNEALPSEQRQGAAS